ncbi:GTP-binding protein [Nitrospira moscoviensis]|uniref:GTP-binding protein n=1 Tax=Nitrospira moscoviensis TaxID=42253 RepID=UPI001650F904|nr:GTP-binding protein [Nitrospira moscoviensis]
MDPDRLEDWLRRFQRSVVRLKGFVKVPGRDGWQELQWIMGSLAITPYKGGRQSRAQIVVIGRRVPWERFLKGLAECLVRPPRQTKRWSRTRRKRP